jgi:hypothetical protein
MKKYISFVFVCLAFLISQNELRAQIHWSTSADLFQSGDNGDFVSQQGTFVLGINPGGADTTIGTSVFLNIRVLERRWFC